jgi:membrane fusion protein (multidrug efflux system)
MGLISRHPVILAFAVIVAALVAITANTWLANKEQSGGWGNEGPTFVVTESVRLMTLVDAIESIGTAQANESVTLSSKVTETVRKVNFEDGDYVKQGAILVELTNAEETAQLAEAQATLDEATRQLGRITNLINQKLASELALDEELARKQTAAARLEAIIARLDDRLIRAPFSGVLGFRNVSQGSLLSPNAIVTTLDDISLIKLNFSIPEQNLANVAPGQEVMARSVAYPERVFRGVVTGINSRVDPVTRAVGIRARIDNDQELLRPGMLLNVSLTQASEDVIVVPEEAIVPVQSQEYVYTVSASGTAERVLVQTGRRKPGFVEIRAGLDLGQPVITQGVVKIRPGAPVTTEPQTPGARP